MSSRARRLLSVVVAGVSACSLLVRPATAEIKPMGDAGFKNQVNQALQAIASSSPECAGLIQTLRDSNFVHRITKSNIPVSTNRPFLPGNASNGVGTGSVTRWNPSGSRRYSCDVLSDPVAVLKHELVHALDANEGIRDPGPHPVTGDKKNEIKAVTQENTYRMAAGLPQRMKYGALLPACRETRCSGGECDIIFRSCYDSTNCTITHRVMNMQTVHNSCVAIDEIPLTNRDLEDLDDGDDDHIFDNIITGVAAARLVTGASLCCGDDISAAATCTTCNAQTCTTKYWKETLDKSDDITSGILGPGGQGIRLQHDSIRIGMPGSYDILYSCFNMGAESAVVTWTGTPLQGITVEPGAAVTASFQDVAETEISGTAIGAVAQAAEVVGSARAIVPTPDGSCTAASGCQSPDEGNGFASDLSQGVALAENFRSTHDSAITEICWWGSYADGASCGGQPDDFTVTYFASDGPDGLPGTVRAGPFAVSPTRTPTGNLVAGLFPEHHYEAQHSPVFTTSAECLWIEIVNDTPCGWSWSQSLTGDDRWSRNGVPQDLGLDLALCLDIAIDADGCGPNGTFARTCEGSGPDGSGLVDCPCASTNNAAAGSTTGCLNSSGVGALLAGAPGTGVSISSDAQGSGSPSDGLQLAASQMVQASASIFLCSNNPGGVPLPTGVVIGPPYDGVLCVTGGARVNAAAHNQTRTSYDGIVGGTPDSGADCVAVNGGTPADTPGTCTLTQANNTAIPGYFFPGGDAHFQLWYRDNTSFSITCVGHANFSNALSVFGLLP